MASNPAISSANIRNGDHFFHVELTLKNPTPHVLQTGGLRFSLVKSDGQVIQTSVANFWPVPPDTTIALVAILPIGNFWSRAVTLKGFEYVETSGRVIPLDSGVDIGMLGGVTMTS